MFRALKPLLFSFSLLWLVGPLAAGIPGGYYDGTAGLSGDALKGRLHDIIQGHIQLPDNSSSQTDTRDALKVLEQDPANAAERQRNDRIYSDFQSNRNPFIDHPEWVAAVYAPVPGWSGQTAATAAVLMFFAVSRRWRSRGGG